MSHQQGRADSTSIELNGTRFHVAGSIDESIVNIHGRKQGQGDPGPDDHPINSTWIQSDWTGGGQVKWGSPDVVTGRFDFATAETMQAKSISLPPLATSWTDPGVSGGTCMALGQYDNKNWASWGSDVRKYNSSTNVWDDLASNLTGGPVYKGTVFVPSTGALAGTDVFCIPLGSSFDYINTVAITNVAKAAVDFAVMNTRLYRLGQSGEIEYTADLSTWSGLTYIPDGSTARHIDVYLTVGGEPTIYVTTNAGVWALDEVSGTLFQTQLQYPRHPDQGKASCVWRGDMYVSVADGVHRYNRSTISAVGMDRDDGLPTEYKGVIVDLEPSYNAIYALVSGVEEVSASTADGYWFTAGDDYMTTSSQSAYSILMRWNGFGWHFVDSITGTAPTTVFVSDASEGYAVWYAADKKMHRIQLTRTYMNLKDNVTIPVAASAYFESSWYNFGWEGQIKTLKTIELFVEDGSSDEYVDVFYKIDNDTNPWIKIGRVEESGEQAFYFGIDNDADPDTTDPDDFNGIASERVKLRFELHRGSTTTNKPIIKWFSVVARKILRPVRTFRLVLDITTTNGFRSEELRTVLLNAVRSSVASTFVYQNETLKVDVVATEFRSVGMGTKIVYTAKMNLIETNETIRNDNSA